MSPWLFTRVGLGEPACLCPSLWMAKCSFPGVNGRMDPLMFCLRDGSGVLRPNLDSKESRLRYVRSADMRAADRPVDGGYIGSQNQGIMRRQAVLTSSKV